MQCTTVLADAAALLHASLFSEQSSLDGFSLHFLPQPLSKG